MTLENELWTVTGDVVPGGHLGERIDFIVNAPMPHRLRNALINDFYTRLAETLAARIGPGPDGLPPPNWFAYGAWASMRVGEQLATRWRPGSARMARAFGDGNADVFHEMAEACRAFLQGHGPSPTSTSRSGNGKEDATVPTDPGLRGHREESRLQRRGGEPVGPGERGERPDHGSADGPPADRESPLGPDSGTAPLSNLSLGFACYHEATLEPDPVRRSEWVLLGNAYLALQEQQRLDEHLGVALRVAVRRFTTPPHALLLSQRKWRQRTPYRFQLRAEDQVIGFLTRHRIGFALLGAELRSGLPLAVHPDDAPEPTVGFVGHRTPFEMYPPAPNRSATCWADLDDRMRFINLVFRHTHRWPWFEPCNGLWELRYEEPPPEVSRLQRTYVDRYLSGTPVDRIALRQRPGACTPAADAIDDPVSGKPWATAQDWQDAHRFYAANRTMILLALLTRSLPASFASPEGAAVIDPAGIGLEPLGSSHSRALIGDAFARVDGTLDFVEALLGSDTGGEIADVLTPVRIAHHQYRRRLLQGGTSPVPGVPTWPSEELGEPISLEQLLGTVCVFVVPVREMLEASLLISGNPPWDAWARVWAEVGRGLGLPHAFLEHQLDGRALTYDALAEVGERIEVANRSRSLSGVRLLDHLVRHLTDGFPRPLAAFASQAVQALGDPEVNRILLAPSTPGGVALRAAFAGVARAPEPVRRGWRAAVGAGGSVILAELRNSGTQGPSLLELFPAGCESTSAPAHRRNGRIDK